MKHIESKKLSKADRDKFFEMLGETMYDPLAPIEGLASQINQEFKGKLDTDLINGVLLDNSIRTRMLFDDYVGLDSTITQEPSGDLKFNRVYQQGGAINFDSILNSFGNLGVNTEGVKVDDPKQSINNLMLAMAASQMFMKGDNNIDLSSPLYMQQGGLLQPGQLTNIPLSANPINRFFGAIDPIQQRKVNFGIQQYNEQLTPDMMPLAQYKKGFGNRILQGLGFQKSNQDRAIQNQMAIKANQPAFDQIQAAQKAQEQKTQMTNDFAQMPMLLGMFSALANMKKGGEVMLSDVQTDGTKIPIQAEKGEKVIDPETGEIADVWARESHDSYRNKGQKNRVTDMPKPGSYIFSDDLNNMKIDWRKVDVYLRTPHGYEENPKKKSQKPKEPEIDTMANVLGLGKGASAKLTPAEAVDLVSKKFKIDKDTNDPYVANSSAYNKKYRDYLANVIKQEAEMSKGAEGDLGLDEIIMAQAGYQLPVPQINNPYRPTLSTIPIEPVPGLNPNYPINPMTGQPLIAASAVSNPSYYIQPLPSRPLPTLSSTTTDYRTWTGQLPQSAASTQQANTAPATAGSANFSGIGATLASGIGAGLSLAANKRYKDTVERLSKESTLNQSRLFNDRKRALTDSALTTMLTNLGLETGVERQKFDDSYYRQLNPEARQAMRNQDRARDLSILSSSIRSNPYLDQRTASQAIAQAARQMYNSKNTDAYLKDLDTRGLGLQEIMNKRYADEAAARRQEVANENQVLSALGETAAKQPMLLSDNDFALNKILADIENAKAAQMYNLAQARNRDIGTLIGAPFSLVDNVASTISKVKGLG